MVVDTSVLLAVVFDERHSGWAADRLSEHRSDLRMSTANLAEALIVLRDRVPTSFLRHERELLDSGIRFVPVDTEQARLAAEARLRFPLNLGDCFAYALARAQGCTLITLDEDFRAVDVPVLMPN